ncbi:MAG: hypothetical protein MH219_05420 [Marinobacter sp.]|nr:hypothetical protein [Marinobacter sp.]
MSENIQKRSNRRARSFSAGRSGIRSVSQGNVPQQRAVVLEALRALYQIDQPGTIVDLPFRWRREKYDEYIAPTADELQ